MDQRQETKVKQKKKKTAEPAVRAHIGAWRLSSRAYLLAMPLFCFLTFSSLVFEID